MTSPKSRRIARTPNPPLPVWIGIPSAWLTTSPLGPAMKQEKSCAWLKIGLRAVRTITQPIWCEIWSSRFWVSAKMTGSRFIAAPPVRAKSLPPFDTPLRGYSG